MILLTSCWVILGSILNYANNTFSFDFVQGNLGQHIYYENNIFLLTSCRVNLTAHLIMQRILFLLALCRVNLGSTFNYANSTFYFDFIQGYLGQPI